MADLHKAIRTIHNNTVSINGDTQETITAWDKDENEISINWTAVNSKNTELINEDVAIKTATANNKTSGKAKLKAGEALTDAEITALFGD